MRLGRQLFCEFLANDCFCAKCKKKKGKVRQLARVPRWAANDRPANRFLSFLSLSLSLFLSFFLFSFGFSVLFFLRAASFFFKFFVALFLLKRNRTSWLRRDFPFPPAVPHPPYRVLTTGFSLFAPEKKFLLGYFRWRTAFRRVRWVFFFGSRARAHGHHMRHIWVTYGWPAASP